MSTSNAAVLDLPILECSNQNGKPLDESYLPYADQSNQDLTLENETEIDPNELSFANWHFDEITRLLEISWLPTINMSYYSCDQVQVQCVPSIKSYGNEKSSSKEVYSKPLDCDNITNHTLINVVG